MHKNTFIYLFFFFRSEANACILGNNWNLMDIKFRLIDTYFLCLKAYTTEFIFDKEGQIKFPQEQLKSFLYFLLII